MTGVTETVRSTIQKRDAKGAVRHGGEWLQLWSDPDSMKSREELRTEAAARGVQLQHEHRLAASARALSGDPLMQIRFGVDGGAAFAPSGAGDAKNLSALRGEIDSAALVRRHHDPVLHLAMAPSDPSGRGLFDLCEEVRCEALGARHFRGVAGNLVAHHRDRLAKSDLLHAHLASLIPLVEGLRMVLRDSLLGAADPSIASSGFWMWDQWLRARFASHLMGLAAEIADQGGYAALALDLIDGLVAELGRTDGMERKFQPTTDRAGAGDEEGAADRLKDEVGGDLFEPGGEFLPDGGESNLARLLTQDAAPKAPAYVVFSRAHDLVARAADLVEISSLRKERAALDKRRAEFRRDFARLVSRLQRKLLARQTRDWSFDLEEGLIDASRLDRIVVDPGFASAYKQERESQFRDTVVAILIDNSGSMRGKPIDIACLASDMISAALERCGVSCEILGFTTRGWKGGQSAKDWARASKPADPGRLNDLLHIIYKSADEPVRRSRLAVAAMLDTSILKENIDGEALLWASRRLLQRPEARKVLIVISDGAPIDQATIEENRDKAILDRHLREVIAGIETASPIELAAIGVKHDVAGYYANSVRIDRAETMGQSLVAMIDLFLTR